jgi:hypothetical protein
MASETNYTNKIVIVDVATGTVTEREMTLEELEQAQPIVTIELEAPTPPE